VPEQHRVGREVDGCGDDLAAGHGTELAVDEADDVAVVDERAADREQAQRRQVVIGNAAAD
jgi:hypothetical protein